MRAYHGTSIRGLTTLHPFASPHSNLNYPCVYLSTNKPLSAIYIWNKPFKWMTFEIHEDGIPVYNESFAHGLREFYQGVKGCIYTCEGDFEADEKTTIRHAVVSKSAVTVIDADEVDDVYERILQYEKEGLLLINRYEDLSDARRKSDRSMVLGAIKGLNLLAGEHPLSPFVAEKFPALWEEAARQALN